MIHSTRAVVVPRSAIQHIRLSRIHRLKKCGRVIFLITYALPAAGHQAVERAILTGYKVYGSVVSKSVNTEWQRTGLSTILPGHSTILPGLSTILLGPQPLDGE